jgi:osmotically-inducible protein OsmY
MADNENRWTDERNRYRRGDEDRNRWSAEGGDYRGGEYRERGRENYDYGSREYGGRESGGRDYGRYGREDYGHREDYGGRGFGGGRDYGGYGREERGYGGREDYRGRSERGLWDRASDEVSSWFGDRDAERRRQEDEMRAGQHRGRGPRGYSRSDDRIRDDVNDRLTDDPYIDASEIDVSVQNSEVTLSGTVDSRQVKRRAEDIVENISGVKHVQNNLRVRQQAATGVGSWTSGSTGAGTSGTTTTTASAATPRTAETSETTRTTETSGTRT